MMRPILTGAVMGAMMLWMLHDRIMSDGVSAAGASLAFIAAHVAVVGLLAMAALLFPKVRGAVQKHKPSVAHFGFMLVGMSASAALIHFSQHGLFA